jgi:hypothetical protein
MTGLRNNYVQVTDWPSNLWSTNLENALWSVVFNMTPSLGIIYLCLGRFLSRGQSLGGAGQALCLFLILD